MYRDRGEIVEISHQILLLFLELLNVMGGSRKPWPAIPKTHKITTYFSLSAVRCLFFPLQKSFFWLSDIFTQFKGTVSKIGGCIFINYIFVKNIVT